MKKLQVIIALLVVLGLLPGCRPGEESVRPGDSPGDESQSSVEEISQDVETSISQAYAGTPSSVPEHLPERRPESAPVEDNSSVPYNDTVHASIPEDDQGPVVNADSTSAGVDTEVVERELLRLVNAERDFMGIEQLGLEESMQWAARTRAQEVLVLLMHTRPNGTPYNTAFDEVGFEYAGKLHGENIATLQFSGTVYNDEEIAKIIFDKLKSSSGHSQNMFSEQFVQVGIGVYAQQNGDSIRIGVAQLFLSL